MIRCRFAAVLLAAMLLTGRCALAEDWRMGRFDEAGSGRTSEAIKLPLTIDWEAATVRYAGNSSSLRWPRASCTSALETASTRPTPLPRAELALPEEQALSGVIKGSPAVVDGRVYFGSGDGNLYALDAATAQYLWAFSTGGAIRSSPVVTDGIVYVGSDENALYAVDAETGEGKWPSGFKTKDDVMYSPVVVGGSWSLSRATRTCMGRTRSPGSCGGSTACPTDPERPPVAIDNVVLIASANTVSAIQWRTGQPRWSTPLPSDVTAARGGRRRTVRALPRQEALRHRHERQAEVVLPGRHGLREHLFAHDHGQRRDRRCDRGWSRHSTRDRAAFVAQHAASQPDGPGDARIHERVGVACVSNGSLYVLTDDGTLHRMSPAARMTTVQRCTTRSRRAGWRYPARLPSP